MNERKRRIAENEAIFRSVNEQIEKLGDPADAARGQLEIVCECGTTSCTDRISIAREDFRRVRADPTLFALKPGHDAPETETVVERLDGSWVVRKDPGPPARVAASLAER